MAVPSPYTWVNGQKPGSTVLNPGIRDVDEYLLNPPSCVAFRATAGAALTAGTLLPINLDGEERDTTGTMHSVAANLSRVVAPEDGVYLVMAQASFNSQTGSIVVDLRRNANGSGVGGVSMKSARVITTTPSTTGQVYDLVQMSAGDYVELFANLTVTASPVTGRNNTSIAMQWFGRL